MFGVQWCFTSLRKSGPTVRTVLEMPFKNNLSNHESIHLEIFSLISFFLIKSNAIVHSRYFSNYKKHDYFNVASCDIREIYGKQNANGRNDHVIMFTLYRQTLPVFSFSV